MRRLLLVWSLGISSARAVRSLYSQANDEKDDLYRLTGRQWWGDKPDDN